MINLLSEINLETSPANSYERDSRKWESFPMSLVFGAWEACCELVAQEEVIEASRFKRPVDVAMQKVQDDEYKAMVKGCSINAAKYESKEFAPSRVVFCRHSITPYLFSINLTQDEFKARALHYGALDGVLFSKKYAKNGWAKLNLETDLKNFAFIRRGQRKVTSWIKANVTEKVKVIFKGKFGAKEIGYLIPKSLLAQDSTQWTPLSAVMQGA